MPGNLVFDGIQTYIEVPDSADFSVATSGGLTVSAWMRPDVLTFPTKEGDGYVHWLGKGEAGQQEWTFRMYGADTTAPADTRHPQGPTRSGRISFYLFNLGGGLGVGSYFQDSLTAGEWIHVVGAADATNTYIYRDGVLRRTQQYVPNITPGHGSANLRVGTRDLKSFFQGSIREVRVWNRCLLRDELGRLLRRCRCRDQLVSGLGASAVARYQPGVRALFVGPSGTGKTLAAGWLATQLGMPLYRVDLAAVTSKYIGETEKDLAQLLARAEHDEIILLFDEADSLFAKRTDVREANDRFANAQTNYLLQRIETFEGIAILTSNKRSRFDSAFARRLDMIVEFPPPRPEERRALWLSHLGSRHALTPPEINQLARAELCGGDIRNAVLAASCPPTTSNVPLPMTMY